jgi:hypothetical protein
MSAHTYTEIYGGSAGCNIVINGVTVSIGQSNVAVWVRSVRVELDVTLGENKDVFNGTNRMVNQNNKKIIIKDMKNRINPIGLKGNEINERMKTLMGISTLNENKSNIVVELTKLGPDNKVYAIIRENHEYYIKSTDKVSNIVSEDFKYIGGLQNKKQEAYSSYAKAIKFLNLKFNSLAEAHDKNNSVNAFLNDDLLTENGLAGGFLTSQRWWIFRCW